MGGGKKMSGYEFYNREAAKGVGKPRFYVLPRFQPAHENPTVPFTAHCRSR